MIHAAKVDSDEVVDDMLLQVERPYMKEKMAMYTLKQEIMEKELPELRGELTVHKVFVFLQKLASVEQKTIYPVYIAKHISVTIRTVLERLIYRYRRDKFSAEYEQLRAVNTSYICTVECRIYPTSKYLNYFAGRLDHILGCR